MISPPSSTWCRIHTPLTVGVNSACCRNQESDRLLAGIDQNDRRLFDGFFSRSVTKKRTVAYAPYAARPPGRESFYFWYIGLEAQGAHELLQQIITLIFSALLFLCSLHLRHYLYTFVSCWMHAGGCPFVFPENAPYAAEKELFGHALLPNLTESCQSCPSCDFVTYRW